MSFWERAQYAATDSRVVTGSFHSGDPSRVDPKFISGCALAIADVDDIGGVNFDNYAVFSVQHDCVNKKLTKFDVPARMPKCTSQYGCICGWRESQTAYSLQSRD